MTFHLFGVTSGQAEALAARHGHTWTRCGRLGCELPVESVFLFAGRDGVVGATACVEHEGEMLDLVQGEMGGSPQAVAINQASAPRGAAWVCPDATEH